MSGKEKPAGMRKTSLELFRILSMLLIIAHHYVVNSGLTDQNGPIAADPLSVHSLSLLLMGAWGKIGINCFVLFSGYFMCEKNITFRKFLKLFCEIMFYRIVIAAVFWISGYEKFSLIGLANALLPVRSVGTGFTSAYLVFFLFIPFLNVQVRHLSEKQHLRLIALLTFTYVFLGTFKPVFSVTMNYVSWFMVLYLISSYIRLYPKEFFSRTRFWGLASVLCMLLCSLSVIACTRAGVRFSRTALWYTFVTDSNTLLAVLTGISFFLFFNNLQVPQSRFINAVAASTFGVFLIHTNGDTMRRWLWKDTLDNVGHYSMPSGYLHAILSVLAVFTVCVCIDQIRLRMIEKPFFSLLDRRLPAVESRSRKAETHLFERLRVRE